VRLDAQSPVLTPTASDCICDGLAKASDTFNDTVGSYEQTIHLPGERFQKLHR
jgi:hypothetical protein